MSTHPILIRTDAGSGIGLGHLQRSLSLADALNQIDIEVRFLSNTTAYGRSRVESRGFKIDLLKATDSWSRQDIQNTCEIANLNGCNTIVVDSHESTSEYLCSIRSQGFFVIARDDLSLAPFPCQMVINGNIDAENLPYQSSSGDTQFLLGTEYMVLGNEFEEAIPRLNQPSVNNLLVILGGADHLNVMPRLLTYLSSLPGNFEISAVIGSFFENIASVESVAKSASRSIRLSYSPASTYDLMIETDLAVSAAGQTLYELACVGCPTVAFSVAANQKTHLINLEKAGVLQSAEGFNVDDVIRKTGLSLASLMSSQERRNAMSAAGQKLVDGKGANRVARKIIAAIGA